MAHVLAATLDGNLIQVRAPFEFRDRNKALPGARYHKPRGVWLLPATPSAAAALHRAYAQEGMTYDAGVGALITAAETARAALKVKEAPDLPEIPGRYCACGAAQRPGVLDDGENPLLCMNCELSLRSLLHQRQAFWYIVNADLIGAMLAMDMGTGKSKTTIALLEHWDAQMTVILCPKKVVGVWPSEFALHASDPDEWHVISPPMRASVQKRAAYISQQVALGRARKKRIVIVCNYDAAWRPAMSHVLTSYAYDVGVCDESHKIKAPGGKASMWVGRLGSRCRRRLADTGTPMPHSPLDLYAQARFLDPGVFGTSFNRFKRRYAVMGGYEDRQVVEFINQDELAEKFGAISFVCKADDVLDLPPKHHLRRRFDLAPKAQKAYDALDADFVLGVNEGTVTVSNALTKLLRLQQVTSGYVRDDDGADHHVGDDKLEELEAVFEELSPTEPRVVVCRFQHDIDTVAALCEKHGLAYGIVSGPVSEGHEKYGLTAASKMRDDITVCIIQEQAGGTGVDLTRAAYCIFYSLNYSLGDYEQVLKRVHRPGQTRRTTYVHLIARGTKDETVYKALRARKNVVEAVVEASRRHNP